MRAELTSTQLKLRITGRLDTLSAPEVLDLFERLQAGSGVESVYMDCEGLRYLSSAGIRVLMIMTKRCPGGVSLANVAPRIMDVIKQTSLDYFISIV